MVGISHALVSHENLYDDDVVLVDETLDEVSFDGETYFLTFASLDLSLHPGPCKRRRSSITIGGWTPAEHNPVDFNIQVRFSDTQTQTRLRCVGLRRHEMIFACENFCLILKTEEP